MGTKLPGAVLRGLALIATVGLAGCVTAEEKLRNNLNTWIGVPVSAYALQNGPPASSFDMGGGKRAFQWAWYGQGPGMIMPMGGRAVVLPPQQTKCQISFIAWTNKPDPGLADWIIETWRWDGNC